MTGPISVPGDNNDDDGDDDDSDDDDGDDDGGDGEMAVSSQSNGSNQCACIMVSVLIINALIKSHFAPKKSEIMSSAICTLMIIIPICTSSKIWCISSKIIQDSILQVLPRMRSRRGNRRNHRIGSEIDHFIKSQLS